MADTAAHLVERVLPEVPVRQWVLTLPFALRYRLAFDARLASAVLREFLLEVFASYRRRARRCGPVRRPRCGAVTFIQRFGDALNLNVQHEHYGMPGMRFRPLPPPDDDEIKRVVEKVALRVSRLLDRLGLGTESDPAAADPLATDQPRLAGLAAAAVRGVDGEGRRPARRGDRVDPDELSSASAPRCAAASGFTLHADVAVPARDRRRLERLCRYAARPPVATERLERLPDGRLLYRFRHRWRDGTTAILFEPQQLMQRLVPLIPAPRTHLVRYHGVLAPCAGWRDRVVPIPVADKRSASAPASAGGGRIPRRYAWADLLRRVFALDVLECPACGGPLRILAAIHPPDTTRAILDCLGLPSRPPPTFAARPDPALSAPPVWQIAGPRMAAGFRMCAIRVWQRPPRTLNPPPPSPTRSVAARDRPNPSLRIQVDGIGVTGPAIVSLEFPMHSSALEMSEVVVSVGAFRRMALALPETTEAFHMDHPDFRVRGKIFATLGYPAEGWALVKLTPEQRSLLVDTSPAVFVPANGAWGLRGATSIQLRSASKTMVREALASAWRNVAPKSLARQSDLEAAIRANQIKLDYQS